MNTKKQNNIEFKCHQYQQIALFFKTRNGQNKNNIIEQFITEINTSNKEVVGEYIGSTD